MGCKKRSYFVASPFGLADSGSLALHVVPPSLRRRKAADRPGTVTLLWGGGTCCSRRSAQTFGGFQSPLPPPSGIINGGDRSRERSQSPTCGPSLPRVRATQPPPRVPTRPLTKAVFRDRPTLHLCQAIVTCSYSGSAATPRRGTEFAAKTPSGVPSVNAWWSLRACEPATCLAEHIPSRLTLNPTLPRSSDSRVHDSALALGTLSGSITDTSQGKRHKRRSADRQKTARTISLLIQFGSEKEAAACALEKMRAPEMKQVSVSFIAIRSGTPIKLQYLISPVKTHSRVLPHQLAV